MKEVFVSHSKEDKGIAKKLVSKLESSGYGCFVRSRDIKSGNEHELISKCNVFVLILSEYSQHSEEQIRQIKVAVEEGCVIIPFRTGKTDDSLSTQYLLYSLEWVDPYQDGFDEAYEILTEIIEENTEGKSKISTAKKVQGSGIKLQKSHLTIIIVLFAAVILYLLFFNEDNTNTENAGNNVNENVNLPDYINTELRSDEKVVVGSWRMTDYEDSRSMTPEEFAETMRNVEDLKRRVLLTFNADRTFIRAGFTPQPQKGYWEYDKEKRKIYLIPENSEKKEEINILKLSDSDMTFIVTEVIQNAEGITETVTTKLGFKKQ